jgi:sterol desaturase/sphingolipid hydroxylase (fatty acid hydroxylase superfamily)
MQGHDKARRLFENRVLEGLTRVHPFTPALLWVPVVAWLLWRSFAIDRLDGGGVAALAGGGLLVWSFSEYVIHRFVFHLTLSSPGRRRLQFIVHGVHHAHPDDPMRLLIPPAPAAVAAAVFYGLFRTLLGPASADPFFAAFLAGYLTYDYTHLAIHHRRPRTRLGRYLRRYHMQHHFVTPDARWGVTSPLWDWVFRTTGQPPASPSRIPVTG